MMQELFWVVHIKFSKYFQKHTKRLKNYCLDRFEKYEETDCQEEKHK